MLIDEQQKLCLLDWGMVGRLTEEERFDLIDFLYAIVENDSKRLVESLLVITAADGEVNMRRLERQLLDILDAYLAVPLRDLNLGAMILDITELLRENRLTSTWHAVKTYRERFAIAVKLAPPMTRSSIDPGRLQPRRSTLRGDVWASCGL